LVSEPERKAPMASGTSSTICSACHGPLWVDGSDRAVGWRTETAPRRRPGSTFRPSGAATPGAAAAMAAAPG